MIVALRVAYWIGAILDALAFVQLAFPTVGFRMLRASIEPTPAVVFAFEFAAGLMLGWTLLLIWADRKPLERRMVLPLTMVVIAWLVGTMIYGVSAGLVPLGTMLPQIVLVSAAFLYYGFCAVYSFRLAL